MTTNECDDARSTELKSHAIKGKRERKKEEMLLVDDSGISGGHKVVGFTQKCIRNGKNKSKPFEH